MVLVLSNESIESLCFGIDIVSAPSIGQALLYTDYSDDEFLQKFCDHKNLSIKVTWHFANIFRRKIIPVYSMCLYDSMHRQVSNSHHSLRYSLQETEVASHYGSNSCDQFLIQLSYECYDFGVRRALLANIFMET